MMSKEGEGTSTLTSESSLHGCGLDRLTALAEHALIVRVVAIIALRAGALDIVGAKLHFVGERRLDVVETSAVLIES